MPMDRSEEQRTHHYADHSSEIPAGDAVDEKSKDEFLRQRGQGNSEDDDEDPLLERARFTEHFHDRLFLRRGPRGEPRKNDQPTGKPGKGAQGEYPPKRQ